MTPSLPSPEAADPVDELLAECLAAADPLAAIERAAGGSQPDVAAALRQRFHFLLRAGALPASAPRQLGNFVLHERLGGGGMGIVHRATELPIGRDVALKLIRPEHLWFDGARKRFLREIEAVAALDHPGIVPIYSAGEHDGVPFCAMELVRGESLAAVLARLREGHVAPAATMLRQAGAANWNEACFGIALQIAVALAHGHDRGIVHRDVKPSNIMLGDDGRARLIDFGLARLANADTMTRSGVQPGSLAYMSPEQVRGEDVEARTDVWSLGVTLCELLTLQQPFLAATEAATRARILGSTTMSRGSRLPWDAATVVATAMAPERERRYATMAAFAADLRAFLEHRPIQAQRPGPLLRGRRWLQRHPARAAIWLCGVLAFVVLPTVLLLQERAARDRIEQEAGRARAAETVATQKAMTSQRVVAFLQDLFYEAEPERARGNVVPVRVILDRGVQRIRDELGDEPQVRAELLDTMAQVYANLGLIEPAQQLAAEGMQLRQELHQGGDELRHTRAVMAAIATWQGRDGEAEMLQRQIKQGLPASEPVAAAQCEIHLAYCAWRLGRHDDAERSYQQALTQLRRLLPPTDLTLLDAEHSYARFLVARVDPHAARQLLTDIAGRAATVLPVDHPDRIGIELERAVAELDGGAVDEAATRLRVAIATAERVFDANHPTLAALRQQLAVSLLQSDRFREGLQVLEQVQAAFAATYQAPHLQLARAASLESSFAMELGDLPRAEAAAAKSIAMFEQLFPHGHLDFACVLANQARVETDLGHLDAAEQLANRSVRMNRDLDQRRDDALVLPLCYLADAQALRNERSPAEQNARAALALATTGTPRASRRTLAMAQTCLAEVLLLADKYGDGEQQARIAVDTWAPVSAVGSARAAFVLGWALDNLGRFDDAERQLRATLAALQQHYPPAHPLFGYALGELGVVLARRGQLPAATKELQRAVDIRRNSCGADNPLLGLPLLNLGTVLQLQHREVEAVPIAFECLELVRRHGGKDNRLTPSVLLLLARTVPLLDASAERQQQLATVRTAVDELLPADFHGRDELTGLLAHAK